MDIQVDSDGLTADGVGLCATEGATAAAPVCQPAAADPVSVGLAACLSTSAAALSVLMDHAAQQRAVGGISVARTAGALQSTDERNAAAIVAAAAGEHLAAGAEAATPGGDVADIAAPAVPVPPPLAPPAPLTGEQVSALVHGGPGPAAFRSFAESLRAVVAPQVRSAADDTRQHAAGIGQHWIDGHQQAARNAAAHADWLDDDLHAHVLHLAQSADSAADHAHTLIASTPRPEDFADLHRRLNVAVANWQASGGINAAPVLALSQRIATAQADAVAGYQQYHAAAAAAATTAPPLPKPAPPIPWRRHDCWTAAPRRAPGIGRGGYRRRRSARQRHPAGLHRRDERGHHADSGRARTGQPSGPATSPDSGPAHGAAGGRDCRRAGGHADWRWSQLGRTIRRECERAGQRADVGAVGPGLVPRDGWTARTAVPLRSGPGLRSGLRRSRRR